MLKILKIYDVQNLTNGILSLKFTTTDHYQQGDPGIKPKLLSAKYKKYLFAEA